MLCRHYLRTKMHLAVVMIVLIEVRGKAGMGVKMRKVTGVDLLRSGM